MPTSSLVKALSSGRKEKWRPLFTRLLARLSRVPGIDLVPMKTSLNIVAAGKTPGVAGRVKVTLNGLEVGLNLEKGSFRTSRLAAVTKKSRSITHSVVFQETSEIDEEFLTWVKAAVSKARNSKRRST